MTLLLPRNGITDCSRAIALIKSNPDRFIGAFFVMTGYGFDDERHTAEFRQYVTPKEILQARAAGASLPKLGFCIFVIAGSHPMDISFLIQHFRFVDFEGIEILQLLDSFNIPIETDIASFSSYLRTRQLPVPPDINSFDAVDTWDWNQWNDYAHWLLTECGSSMLCNYWEKQR